MNSDMKILNGLELTGYIKERQAKQIRALRQSWLVIPRLAIICCDDNIDIPKYVRLKKNYAKDIKVEVDIYNVDESSLLSVIDDLNIDKNVHGIVLQLPILNSNLADRAISAIAPEKDVDGLKSDSIYTPTIAMAINWILAGYGIELVNKKITILGNDMLIAQPLIDIWSPEKYDIKVVDNDFSNVKNDLLESDVVISATNQSELIKNNMIAKNTILIDASPVSSQATGESDLAEELWARKDIIITSKIGGLGPLVISALFDNMIQSARKIADAKGQQDLN